MSSGAWTFEDIHSHGEPGREEVTVDWEAEEKLESYLRQLIGRTLYLAGIGYPPTSAQHERDAEHFCRTEIDRYAGQYGHYPDPDYLGYRLCQYFGFHDQAARLLHRAEETARGRLSGFPNRPPR
jgi:hypothetical protein